MSGATDSWAPSVFLFFCCFLFHVHHEATDASASPSPALMSLERLVPLNLNCVQGNRIRHTLSPNSRASSENQVKQGIQIYTHKTAHKLIEIPFMYRHKIITLFLQVVCHLSLFTSPFCMYS